MDAPGARDDIALKPPVKLTWTVDDKITAAIDKAAERVEADISDLDSVLLHYGGFGGAEIKDGARLPPDAFVQMALQLAYYRIHQQPCPTYESASTRQFLHGRTETIRSCSVDSVAFTKAFDQESVKVRACFIDSIRPNTNPAMNDDVARGKAAAAAQGHRVARGVHAHGHGRTGLRPAPARPAHDAQEGREVRGVRGPGLHEDHDVPPVH